MNSRRSAVARAYRVQVLDRAVGILDTLADTANDLGPSEIAERLSLHKSTIHRLLTVLEHHEFIRRKSVNGKYALGLRLFELGNRAVAGLHIRDHAQPFLVRLVSETGETAHACVLDGCDTVSIANAQSPRSVRMPATVGHRTPAHCTSVGKAMLAFLPESAIDAIARQPMRALTRKTLVTRRALIADLAQVRVRGYAIDDEEVEEGLRCIGAPIRDHSGEVVASMSIAGPAFRITKDRIPVLARSVMGVASNLSAELGYRGFVGNVSRYMR